MNNIISSILFTILLIIFGILPISSIPIAIINYKINGLFLGYFSVLIAGTISSFIYYKFANYFVLQFIKKRFKKISFIKEIFIFNIRNDLSRIYSITFCKCNSKFHNFNSCWIGENEFSQIYNFLHNCGNTTTTNLTFCCNTN